MHSSNSELVVSTMLVHSLQDERQQVLHIVAFVEAVSIPLFAEQK